MKTASNQRLMLFMLAPFLGALCWLIFFDTPIIELQKLNQPQSPKTSVFQHVEQITTLLHEAKSNAVTINERVSVYSDSYAKSTTTANELAYRASLYVDKPMQIYDERVTSLLGTAIHHVHSPAIDLKIFPIKEKQYSGYAMKVNLKDPSAMTMVLGKDQLGSSETTLQAAKRYDAIAGVNAGGFADHRHTGMRYPLSTTMVDEQYVNGFTPTFMDLFFVGLNKEGQLIGGKFTKKDELDQLGPVFGASFVPILIQNGEKQEIPSKWLTSPARAARTIIGNYKHDHLLFVVINGKDQHGSSGASLAELQQKLLQYGVINAYNLDGGGSTSLVYNDEVLNTPTDGKLRRLPTHFLFFE